MRKKLLAVLMVVCVLIHPIIGNGEVISATENVKTNYTDEEYFVKNWFILNNFGEHEITEPKDLYSFKGKIIARYYNVDKTGYVIVNLLDYEIMEFSFESRPDINDIEKVVYIRFASFGRDDGESVFDINEKQAIEKDKCSDFIAESMINKVSLNERISSQRSYIDRNDDSINIQDRSYSSVEYGNIMYPLETFTSSTYKCHVTAAAILLRYYRDHYSSDFLPDGIWANYSIQWYLVNNSFLFNMSLSSAHVVYGYLYDSGYMKGMIDYLQNDRHIYSYYADYDFYNFNTIKDLINSNKPVVAESASNIPPDYNGSGHAYVVHGYFVGYDGLQKLVINNGWGSNNVYISASPTYFASYPYGIWYIS